MDNTKIFFVGMMILTQVHASLGFKMCVDINSDAGVLRYRVNNIDTTRGEMTKTLAKSASLFGSNVVVPVSYSTNVSVSELIQTISDIQESGLHLISMMSPGVKNGTNGVYLLNVDCSKMLDGLVGWQRGFTSTNGCSRFYIISNGVVIRLPPDPPPVTRRLKADVLPDLLRPEVSTRPKIEPRLPHLEKLRPQSPIR